MVNERELIFQELIAPTTELEFFSDYWERKHLFVRRSNASFYRDVFCYADVDRSIVAAYGTTQESLTLIPPPDSERKVVHFRPAKISMEKVYAAFNRGDTVRLMSAHRAWPPLRLLAAAIGRAFSAEANINFYLTPARSQGFPVHVDTHEAFILQVEGAKDWFIYEGNYPLPIETLSDMADTNSRIKLPPDSDERLIEKIHLEKGDLLYIPRGVPHKAVASNTSSLHLTVGLHPLYWVDFLKRAVEVVTLDAQDLRKALPPGFTWNAAARGKMASVFHSFLALVLEKAPFEATLDALVKARVASRPYPADGHFDQLTRLDEIGLQSRLTHRDGLECRVERAGKTASIVYASNRVNGPLGIARALEYICDHRWFQVGDLPGLSEQAKLVLARRLVREGLLRQAAESGTAGAAEGQSAASVAP